MVIKFLDVLLWLELMWNIAWSEKTLHEICINYPICITAILPGRAQPQTPSPLENAWDTSGFHSFCGISPHRGERENVAAAGKKT